MNLDFDPRPWNLLAGLSMVAGCSGRTISFDGDSTDSVNDSETTLNPDGPDSGPDGPDSGPDSGPECVDASDCPDGYNCYGGICEYITPDDGHSWYECYSDDECGSLSLCEFNYCEPVYTLPLCDIVLSPGAVFKILEPVLALAFADVDNDGDRELVVATQTQLHVARSGSPTPASNARGIESSSVDAMVGGAFDVTPGDDVIVLHDDELDLHGSDGIGNLMPGLPSPTPYPLTLGLEAGAFDAEPTTDMLAWGANTTGVIYGSGESLDLLGGAVTSASARDLGLPGNGFTVLQNSDLLFVDIGGFIIGSGFLRGSSPRAQASVDSSGEVLEVGSSNMVNWTLVEVFDRLSSSMTTRWGLPGAVTQMRAGDLDALDETDEVALIVDGALWLHVGAECLLQVPLDGPVTEMAFGDHDGDGDDELAVSTATNTVSIVDIE